MEFDKVCFACHRIMSIHTRKDYKECLEELSEKLREIEKLSKQKEYIIK